MRMAPVAELARQAHEAVEFGDFAIVFAGEGRMKLGEHPSLVAAGQEFAHTVRGAHERVEDLIESIVAIGGMSHLRPYLDEERENAVLEQMSQGYYAGLLAGYDLLHGGSTNG